MTTDHRRMTAERNVRAILDAAEELLEQQESVSIAAVAAYAGVSRVTVYAHFQTWEGLLEAVVERAVSRTVAAVQAAEPGRGSPLAALERMLAVAWQGVARHSAIAEAAAELLSPGALTRTHSRAHGWLADLIERGRAEGVFRTDVPAGWLATSCFALIHACLGEIRDGRIDPAEAPRILTVSIRDLFTGSGAT